jgi:hypothetical protein
MANMSYCRFENTYQDLLDCYRNMSDDDDDLSETEARYKKKIIDLCESIASDYGELEDESE